MNKNSYLASVLLAGSLFFGSLSVQAQDRTIKLTTQKPAGEAVTLLVNYTYKGVTVDWGDGQPVVYNTGKEPIREITGTVKGSTITITGDGNWNMLSCADCGLTDIDLTGARDFASLYCQNNQLTTLDIKGMKELTDLDCSNNQIARFSFSGATATSEIPKLENLNISNNQFTGTFNYPLPSLKTLNISNNQFTGALLTSNTGLVSLQCEGNKLGGLAVDKAPNLTALVCSNNNIANLLLSKTATEIRQLVADNNRISVTLDLSAYSNLADLSVSNNVITKLYLPENKLRSLNLSNNKLTFNVLPVYAYRPKYLTFMPQEKLDISKFENVKTVNGQPTMTVVTWENRGKNTLELSPYIKIAVKPNGTGGTNDGIIEWFELTEDNKEIPLVKYVNSTQTPNDYFVNSNKFNFFTPHERVFARIRPNNIYGDTDHFIETTCIAIMADPTTGIGNIAGTDNGLSISSTRGNLTMSAPSAMAVRVISADGKTVWNGTVSSAVTITLPGGIYIVNGKKVVL